MRKDLLNDDFIEDLNEEGISKKSRGAEHLRVEDLNVETSGPGKRKVKEFRVEDLNEDDPPDKPKEPEAADWNRTIIEAAEPELPKVESGLNKSEEQKPEEKPEKKTKKKGKKGETDGEEKKKPSMMKEVLNWSVVVLLAVICASFLKNHVLLNAMVPSSSMENTIKEGDRIYGLRIAYLGSEPQRGDIIIFQSPEEEEKDLVKRVIGLPGEHIRISEAKIYIDDSETPLKEEYLKEQWVKATGPFEYQIPEDSYLVLGDNRNVSKDARYWDNIYVTRDQIIGKAYIIYYPFSRFGSLY